MITPDGEPNIAAKMANGVNAAGIITSLVGAGTVLQAGGCFGLWPLAFASFGWRVITCEPAQSNLAYLQHNTKYHPSIEIHPVALGSAPGRASLARPKPKAGLWTITEGDEVTVTTIDRICGDTKIDAIVLDIEGSELRALAGAEQTIARDRPLIWLECRIETRAIDRWFIDHGYGPPTRVGRDIYALPLDELARTW